jgi:hypothetical protein
MFADYGGIRICASDDDERNQELEARNIRFINTKTMNTYKTKDEFQSFKSLFFVSN